MTISGHYSLDFNKKAYTAGSSVDRTTFASLQKLLSEYIELHNLEGTFPLHSSSESSSDDKFIINNFDLAGVPLSLSITTILRNQGIDSFYVSSVQLHADIDSVNGIILRMACIQGACLFPKLYSVLDKVCLVGETKQMCSPKLENTDPNKVLGLYIRLANLGARSQPNSTYTLNLPKSQKLVKLFKVVFGTTVLDESKRTVVQLAKNEKNMTEATLVKITGRCTVNQTSVQTTKQAYDSTLSIYRA